MKNSTHPRDNEIFNMYAVHGVVRCLYIAEIPACPSDGNRTDEELVSFDSPLARYAASLADKNAIRDADNEHGLWHFGFVLNNKAVSGSFPVVGFKEGDKVAAVVMDAGESALYAHAVVRQNDGLLWIPYCADKGRYAALLWLVKAMIYATLSTVVCMSPFLYSSPVLGGFLGTIGALTGACTIVAVVVLTFMYFTGSEGEYAEQIIKTLGFKKPKIVNLAPFSEFSLHPDKINFPGSHYVYHLVPALKHYDSLPAWHPANKK